MHSDYRRYLPAIYKILIIVVIALLLYFVGLPVLIVLLPFLTAGLIAVAMEPVVRFCQKKLKLGRKLSSLFTLLAYLIVFGTIIFMVIYKIIIELIDLSLSVPAFFQTIDINNEMLYWSNLGQKLYLSVPPNVADVLVTRLSETLATFSSYITGFISSVLTFSLHFVRALPETFVFLIITVISTYFISSDKEKIKAFIFKQFPPSMEPKIMKLKNDLLDALVGFIKAQLILIIISMIIASTGLTILGVKYALTIGMIVGLAELIPVVGTGSIFVPWIIYMLFTKNINIAVGLLCVFLLGVVVRQLIEPKIIGVQIGIYPLVALIAIYIGLSIFGVLGMILGPIAVIAIKSLNSSGLIRIWKE